METMLLDMGLPASILLKICLNGMVKTAKLTFTSLSFHMMLTTLMEKVDLLHTKSMKIFKIMKPGVLVFTRISETIQSLWTALFWLPIIQMSNFTIHWQYFWMVMVRLIMLSINKVKKFLIALTCLINASLMAQKIFQIFWILASKIILT